MKIVFETRVFFKKWANHDLFLFILGLFKQTSLQLYVKNDHPVYGAGIWIHDLWNVSLFT